MRKRGRKSAADIATKPVHRETEAVLLPTELTPEQCEIFEQLIKDLPDGLITDGLVPLVAQLSRHLLTCKRLAAWADRIENGARDVFDSDEYFRVLDQRRKETASALSIMRSLRMTNQSRYRADSAALDRGPKGPPLWGR